MIRRPPDSPLLDIFSHTIATRGFLRAPLRVSLEVTNECNQHCVFCCQSSPDRKIEGGKRHLSLAAVDGLCRRFEEMGVAFLSLTGGEPACHPDFPAVVEYVKRRDIALNIETNGTLLTGTAVRRLGAVLEPERDTVCLSLDAARDITYRKLRGSPLFHAVKAALAQFERSAIPFVVNTLIVRENLDELEEIHHLAARHGTQDHRFSFPHRIRETPPGLFLSADEERDAIARLKDIGIDPAACEGSEPSRTEEPGRGISDATPPASSVPPPLPCSAGYTSCAVDVHGRVAMCWFDLDRGASRSSVHEEDFAALWLEITRTRHALETGCRGENRTACPLRAGRAADGMDAMPSADETAP